jgi:hypothetical protein
MIRSFSHMSKLSPHAKLNTGEIKNIMVVRFYGRKIILQTVFNLILVL